MGASWGSELGLIIADRRPDLVAAYVGTAQVVRGARGLAIGHDVALRAARTKGDAEAVTAAAALFDDPPRPDATERFLASPTHHVLLARPE